MRTTPARPPPRPAHSTPTPHYRHRRIVLEVDAGGGPSAAGAGAGGVPDLGQVPEHDPGIVAPGLPPVVTVPGRQRPDLDEQVLLPGGEPPGSVPAGRPAVIGGGEGERWSAGRIVPVWFAPFGGPGTAMADRVPVLVGDRDALGRPGVTGDSMGEVAGQVGVDEANSVHLAGLAPRCSPWRLQTTRGYPGWRHGR
jgi:hypothetical protein